ncbi:S1C family serine protease [Stieleria varia]|uniref:S1C family serine protease n=1 Tax=Stieleria varia TaxID=2528005 RepID=UPI001E37C7E0|nr:trypsin-like peptidase domain-containing protein [Stieleria varia]
MNTQRQPAGADAPPQVIKLPADRVSGEPARTLVFHRIQSSRPHIHPSDASDGPSSRMIETDGSDLADCERRISYRVLDVATPESWGRGRRVALKTTGWKSTGLTTTDRKKTGQGRALRRLDDLSTHGARSTEKARVASTFASSLTLLATVAIMLASARYVVPPIVEEIRYAQHRGQLRAEFEVGSDGLKNVSMDTLSQAYQMVTAAAGPSVVHIDVHRPINPVITAATGIPGGDMHGADMHGPEMHGFDDRDRFHSPDHPEINDQGSGVVVDKAGYILTNRHVIADGEIIDVTLSDGRRVQAQVIGTDALTDLALLKVDASGLIPIPWGDSDRIRVGSPVWAIGSPFGLDRTVTFGILSGKHRLVRASSRYQDFMQSDVAVNPGNSGGPLVDARGTLVGINTAIVGDTYQGVSFSIPSSVAKEVYERLRDTGYVQRGWLGVFLAEVPDEQFVGSDHRTRGALITGVADSDAGAARAGLKTDDIIIEVNGENIRDMGHLMRLIGNATSGTTIPMRIRRDGEELTVKVTLGSRPDRLNVR